VSTSPAAATAATPAVAAASVAEAVVKASTTDAPVVAPEASAEPPAVARAATPAKPTNSKAGPIAVASPSSTTATPGRSAAAKVYLPPSKAAAAAAAAAEAVLRGGSSPGRVSGSSLTAHSNARNNKRPRDQSSSKGGMAAAAASVDSSTADGSNIGSTTASRRDVLWQQPATGKARPEQAAVNPASQNASGTSTTTTNASDAAAAAALVLDTNVDNFFFGDGPTPAQCALPPNNRTATATRDAANDKSSNNVGGGSSSSSSGSSSNKGALEPASRVRQVTVAHTASPSTQAPSRAPTIPITGASAVAPSRNLAQALVAATEVAAPPVPPPRPAGLIGSSFGMVVRRGATTNAPSAAAAPAAASVPAAPSNKRPGYGLAMESAPPAKVAKPHTAASGDSSSDSNSNRSTLYTSPLSPWYLAGGAPKFGASHGRPEWLEAHKAREAEKQRKARENARLALVTAQRANMRPNPLDASARLTDADWLCMGNDNDEKDDASAGSAAAATPAGQTARVILTPGATSESAACSPLEVAAQERAAQRKFMASLTAAIVGHGGDQHRK